MELKIDLLRKKEKSKTAILLASVSILFSIIWIPIKYLDHKILSASDWVFSFYFAVYGVLALLMGFGYHFERIWGTSFIDIDHIHIVVKSGVWSKKQAILWNDIQSMDYKTNWFEIKKYDGSTFKLKLSDLEYIVLIETRNTINFIAADKRIAIT